MPSVGVSGTWSTSSDLLSMIRRRDPSGWRRFVDLYGPMIYGWCRKSGLDTADAGDVTQEVFSAVFAKIGEFEHGGSDHTLRGWLRIVCRNKALDLFRRRGNAPQAAGGTQAKLLLSELAEPEDAASATNVNLVERHGLVRRAADLVRGEFEARTWQAFWLMAVENQSAADAAEATGMTPAAARNAKYKVLRRLREQLSGDFD